MVRLEKSRAIRADMLASIEQDMDSDGNIMTTIIPEVVMEEEIKTASSAEYDLTYFKEKILC